MFGKLFKKRNQEIRVFSDAEERDRVLADNKAVEIDSEKGRFMLLKKGDKFYAFEPDCPHQGYPLKEGHCIRETGFMCRFHRWEWDLESGEELMGRDGLKIYKVIINDDGSLSVNMD